MQWLRRIWYGDPAYRKTFKSGESALLTRAVLGYFVCLALGSTFKVLANRGIFFTRPTAGTAADILLGAAITAVIYAGVRLYLRIRLARRVVLRHDWLACPLCLYPCPAIEQQSPATCTECGGYLVHDEIVLFWQREFPKDATKRDQSKGPTP